MEKQQNRPLRKRALAATAIVVVAALLLGGTYAWQLIVGESHLTGEAYDEDARNYDITLVEKFDAKDDWSITDAPLQKEVSVVNNGDVMMNYYSAYVRITLKEYFEFAEKTDKRTTERYMIYDGIRAPFTGEVTAMGTGVPNNGKARFVMFDTQANALAAYPGHEIVQTGLVTSDGGATTSIEKLQDAVSGDNANDNYWFVKTQEEDANGQYGKFMPVVNAVGTAESIEAFAGGTPGLDWPIRADEDAKVSTKHNVGENGECAYSAVHVTDTAAGSKNELFREWVTRNLGATSNVSNLMSLSDFADPLGNESQPVAKWIYNDTDIDPVSGFLSDPYLYWGEFLAPGASAANALDSIELAKQPNGPFYYALHADMEAVSLDELDANPDWSNIPVEIKNSFIYYAPNVKASDIKIKVGDKLTLSQLIGVTAADVVISPNAVDNKYAYPNAVLDVKAIAAPAGNGIVDIDAGYDLEALAPGEVYVTVILNSGDRTKFKVTVESAPVPVPVVTAFAVDATGDATGSGTWNAAGTNTIDLNVVNTKTKDITINLAGAITGQNLPNPALTTWTPDAAKWNVAASADAENINIVIPKNDAGTMRIIAAAKDDPSKTITINVKAVANTLAGPVSAWFKPNNQTINAGLVTGLYVLDVDPATITAGGAILDKWFVGETPDDDVWAWARGNGPGTTIYISAKGGVSAPVDSSELFQGLQNGYNYGAIYDVRKLDTSKTTNMSSMFEYCEGVGTITGFNSFDTSKVTDMSGMFRGCYTLRSLDVSSFDTSNVTNMASMFQNCEEWNPLGVNNFDTSKVTDMSNMFMAVGASSLDLSGWDTSNVTNMNGMLCIYYLDSVNIRGWDLSKVSEFDNMFDTDPYLRTINMRDITLPTGAYTQSNMFVSLGSQTGTTITVSSQAVKDWLLEFNINNGSRKNAKLPNGVTITIQP